MIKIDSTIQFLKKIDKPVIFDEIFENVKDKLPKEYSDINELKAQLLNSIIGSLDIVRINKTEYALAEKYSLEELERIRSINQDDDSDEEGEL